MRILPAALFLAMLVSGCGGGGNGLANGAANLPANAAASLPAEGQPTDAESPEADESQWLHIEARGGDDGFNFFAAGKPVDLDALRVALQTYAQRKDEAAGLPGAIGGVSGNPIRFSAAPDVSALSFWVVIELMAQNGVHRVRAEVLVDNERMTLWAGLPVDEGLGGPKGPEVVGADMRVTVDRDRVEYLVRNDDGDFEPLQGTGYSMDVLATRDAAAMEKLRDSLTAGVKARETAAGVQLDEIELAPSSEMMPTKEQFAPWGAIWIAIAAIEKLAKHDKHKIVAKFKFAVAIDAYSKD